LWGVHVSTDLLQAGHYLFAIVNIIINGVVLSECYDAFKN